MTIWIGVDPGLANLGIAVLERQGANWKAVATRTVKTSSKVALHGRLAEIYVALTTAVREAHDHRLRTALGRTDWLAQAVRFAFESQEGARMGARRKGETNYHDERIERVLGMIFVVAMEANYHREEHYMPLEVTPAFMRKCVGLKNGATKSQLGLMVRRLVSGISADATGHELEACAAAIAGERLGSSTASIRRKR